MELFYSILGFIIAIGILVTFHEYGHFIVARFCNVKVLKFSVGFGKPIYSSKSKNSSTEYSLCMIPLGGYVQMLESKTPEGESNNINESDYKYCFDKKSVFQRFAIVAAGPIFNLILAVIFFTFTYMNGIGGIKPIIKINDTDDTYQVISVNETSVKRWQDVRIELLNNIMDQNNISLSLIDKDNNPLKYDLPYNSSILNSEGDIIQNIGIKPFYPSADTTIGSVSNDTNNKNIQVGDKILSINETIISSWNEFVQFIRNNPDTKISITANRNNQIVVYDATVLNKDGNGFLGVSRKPDMSNFVDIQYNFNDSFNKAINSTSDYTILTFKMIGRLVVGDANVKNLSGPLSIAQFSGRSLEMGLSYFLYLLAILSVSLGVLNLLPIPMLDGGHLVYYTYEMITGRELPQAFQYAAQVTGVAILGLIMIIAFYNDFIRIFS